MGCLLGFLLVLSVQGAALMSKFGVNVPKGVVVSSKSEIAKVLKEQFPKDEEVRADFQPSHVIDLL